MEQRLDLPAILRQVRRQLRKQLDGRHAAVGFHVRMELGSRHLPRPVVRFIPHLIVEEDR